MLLPFAVVAAGLVTPLMATAVLSLALVGTASSLTRSATVSRPSRRPVAQAPATSLLDELAQLHDALKLDARQDALWCKAQKAGWTHIGDVQSCLRKQREATLALLAGADADLRAVARCLDAQQSEHQAQCAAHRELWLNVYDALDADQKTQVRSFLKALLERGAAQEVAERAGVTQSLS